jgi:hypothetical protein
VPQTQGSSRTTPRARMYRPLSTQVNRGLADLYEDKPFPRPRVEFAFGADLTADQGTWTWVDVTDYVRVADGLSMRHGRGDGANSAEPSNVSFGLNNLDGRFTPYLPTSIFYPYVRTNTPVRVYANYGAGDVLRGTFYVDSWEPGWDYSLNLATVKVSAAGLIRHFQQGNRVARSLLTTWNMTDPKPIAYWPGEDQSGSTSLEEIVGYAAPFAIDETNPSFASAGPPGSKPLLKFADRTELRVDLPDYGNDSEWTISFVVNVPTAPSLPGVPLIMWNTGGDMYEWRISIIPTGGTDTIGIEAWDTSGVQQISNFQSFVIGTVSDPYAHWLLITVNAYQFGGTIQYSVDVIDQAHDTNLTWSNAVAGTLGRVWGLGVHNGWSHTDYGYGHFVLYDFLVSYPNDILSGFEGQSAADRISDACTYEVVTADIEDSSSQTMGPWPVATFLDNVKECEAADGGILYDTLTGKLGYRARGTRYNQTAGMTLDFAAGQVTAPFAPVLDDQKRRNEWTVTRTGGNSGTAGSSATYRDSDDQAEHGRYSDSVSLNVDTDDMLIHQAGWRVNLGTVEGMRYARLSLDLARNPTLASSWTGMALGDRITVTNLPATHPPGSVDLVLDGYVERIFPFGWRVEANCSPYLPWQVFTVASDTQGRVESDSSTLAASVNTTATTLSVAATELWTTTGTFPADFPFSIDVGGEQMSVTAITGTSSPQSFTVTRSVNGVVKEHQYGTSVRLWRAAPLAL